jgi:WhiB family redox-sensing transcriptional regulator
LRHIVPAAPDTTVSFERWWDDAACKGVDINRIYPLPYEPKSESQDKMKRFVAQFCRKCPVKAPCLAEAIRLKDKFGVWGGVLPHVGKRASVNAQRYIHASSGGAGSGT